MCVSIWAGTMVLYMGKHVVTLLLLFLYIGLLIYCYIFIFIFFMS